jgi:hypothetical protein
MTPFRHNRSPGRVNYGRASARPFLCVLTILPRRAHNASVTGEGLTMNDMSRDRRIVARRSRRVRLSSGSVQDVFAALEPATRQLRELPSQLATVRRSLRRTERLLQAVVRGKTPAKSACRCPNNATVSPDTAAHSRIPKLILCMASSGSNRSRRTRRNRARHARRQIADRVNAIEETGDMRWF